MASLIGNLVQLLIYAIISPLKLCRYQSELQLFITLKNHSQITVPFDCGLAVLCESTLTQIVCDLNVK